MRTTLVTAILLGTLVPSVMAEGEGTRHGWRDGQGDGKGGETERRKRPHFGGPGEMFRRMDKDQDGKITREEFYSSPRLERLPEEKRDRIFARLDRDGDGIRAQGHR